MSGETFIEKVILQQYTKEDMENEALNKNALLLFSVLTDQLSWDGIKNELYEICDSVHASCDDNCPIYRLNGDKIPNRKRARGGCDCFKNGQAMLDFILEHGARSNSKGATCPDCGEKMIGSISCTKKVIEIGNKVYKRNTTYYDLNLRCHDCGIINKKGNVHHLGCDMERCPKCRGQLISCGCLD